MFKNLLADTKKVSVEMEFDYDIVIAEVPVQKFEINPQYIGKHFDFYYLDDNKNEQFAFSNVKDV